MKKTIHKILHPFYKKYHFWYHSKPRKYVFKDVYTVVQPGVFSPKNTVSTKVFLDFISGLNVNQKQVLELGCGSGIISIFSAKKGANVTASDINKTALKSLNKTAIQQGLTIKTVYSNLFENLNKDQFDFIFINPPYYPKQPKNEEEKAWFCGEDFEYFENLFHQLVGLDTNKASAMMILSDACEIEMIQKIAKKNGFRLMQKHQIELTFEINTIYILEND